MKCDEGTRDPSLARSLVVYRFPRLLTSWKQRVRHYLIEKSLVPTESPFKVIRTL